MAKTGRAVWERRVRDWKASGLTAKEYGAKHRLKHRALTWWRWKLGREATTELAPLTFVELPPPHDADASRFEVVLPNGRRLVVPAGFDQVDLSRLLAVVDGP